MNATEFARWLDFATRMAQECYGTSRRPPAAWILHHVTEFIALMEDERETIRDWDADPVYICDRMSEYVTDHGYFRVESRIWQDEDGYDRNIPEALVQRYLEQWEDQWFGPVRCCVRAGLDVAVSSSGGGVLGFTVGDLRRMYPEGLPTWLTDLDWDVPLQQASSDDGVWL